MEEKITFRPFDLAHSLDSEEEIVEFLRVAFLQGDAAHIAHCLGIVARARNMAQLARDVGMSRPALYKALSGEGNPEFATVMKIMHALGIGLAPVSRKNDEAA
ncbi:addiction module antidote protein [Shinella zoogloeoides]|uniref:addiction module antidote protein n=1 Tax=Shinella zoogloeoides TaxID=352475 RepID=UPI003D6B24A9